MYAMQRDLAHALELGARIAHEHPRSVHARSNLAVYNALAGKFAGHAEDAVKVLVDAIAADGDNHDAAARKQALLAEAQLRRGDRARARAAADAAAMSAIASTRFVPARVYIAVGEPAKALALADRFNAVTAFETALHISDSWLAHEALGAPSRRHPRRRASLTPIMRARVAIVADPRS